MLHAYWSVMKRAEDPRRGPYAHTLLPAQIHLFEAPSRRTKKESMHDAAYVDCAMSCMHSSVVSAPQRPGTLGRCLVAGASHCVSHINPYAYGTRQWQPSSVADSGNSTRKNTRGPSSRVSGPTYYPEFARHTAEMYYRKAHSPAFRCSCIQRLHAIAFKCCKARRLANDGLAQNIRSCWEISLFWTEYCEARGGLPAD